MKKIIVICSLALTAFGCANNTNKEDNKDSVASAASGPEASPDYDKGLSLIAKSDCLTCHKVDEKLTGPAYKEVANKYPNTPETVNDLAGKIIKGGAGVWGDIPMTPHSSVSEEDAKQMVKYILLLKNK